MPTSGNVFFGYSYYSSSLSPFGRTNMNGWEASVEGKVLPFIGLVADFDQHYGSRVFSVPVCPVGVVPCGGGPLPSTNFTQSDYLFGPRVSISVARLRPFAEVLFGAGHAHENGIASDTSFATAVGGGLDFKLIKLVAWRVQGDYVHTALFNSTQSDVRVSTGIAIHF